MTMRISLLAIRETKAMAYLTPNSHRSNVAIRANGILLVPGFPCHAQSGAQGVNLGFLADNDDGEWHERDGAYLSDRPDTGGAEIRPAPGTARSAGRVLGDPKRDLAYLKDRLNAPIVFDRDLGGYRFETESSGSAH